MEANYFTILYWFCHTSKWISHRCARVPHPEPPSHLPPHTIPLAHPSAPAPSILYPASNLDWQFVSYMILYMFRWMHYHFFFYNSKLCRLCYSWILLESRSNKLSFLTLYQILKVMLHYVYFVAHIMSQTFVSFIFLDNLNFFSGKEKYSFF